MTARLAAAGRGRPRQAQHGRVRHGLVDRGQRVQARPQSLVDGARSGRLLGRLGGRGRRFALRRRDRTDTGGSIRQPAALCGVVGVKPTYGRVSRYGVIAFASSLDHPGPFGRTVEDAAAMLEVMAGADPLDAPRFRSPSATTARRRAPDARVWPAYGWACRRNTSSRGWIQRWKAPCGPRSTSSGAPGAKIVPVSLPHTKYAIATYYLICTAEASSNLARYDGIRYGHRTAEARSLEELYTKTRGEGFGTEPKRRIMLGAYVLRAGFYEAYYGKALRVRRKIADDFQAAFASCDAIVTPTSPVPAFKFGERMGDPLQMYLADVLTVRRTSLACPRCRSPAGSRKPAFPSGFRRSAGAGRGDLLPRGGCLRIPDGLAHAPACRGDVVSLADYEVVIGLETHVQLATRSKIFSWSSAAFGAEPNTTTDPVCLGLPGTLPVLNRAAVEAAVRLGLASGCTINQRCRFARKHYFYPDLPKGFQITQLDEPICIGGTVRFRMHGEIRSVRLVRIHMEEDTGKNIHSPGATSFVDYNRAGVPLCEVVSEPDVHSAEEAAEYLRALRTLVRYLGIGDGNMEEGSLRCDANVSLRLKGATQLGTKTEIKNMNSFKNVRDAIEHEVKRQAALLDRGERIVQETRLWDPTRGVTQAMRSKEQAHDYRYLPEPDLPPVAFSDAELARLRGELPELPEDRYARYVGPLGLPAQDASVLVTEREVAAYFDAVVAAGAPAKRAANWVINEVLARAGDAEGSAMRTFRCHRLRSPSW